MAYTNLYVPPTTLQSSDPWGPEPYDINFCLPLPADLSALASDRVRLVPFVPRVHARPFFESVAPVHDALMHHLPFKFRTLDALLAMVEDIMRARTENVLFAVFDTTARDAGGDGGNSGVLAGMIGLVTTRPESLTTEIGPVLTLPAFQRTHVTTHAIGLLLRYCLNVPTDAVHPGLGLRRVEWVAYPANAPSVKAASRMGLREDGLLRWRQVFTEPYAEGKTSREGDPRREGAGVDWRLFAICWDDWEGGGRENVEQLMRRV